MDVAVTVATAMLKQSSSLFTKSLRASHPCRRASSSLSEISMIKTVWTKLVTVTSQCFVLNDSFNTLTPGAELDIEFFIHSKQPRNVNRFWL